MSRRKREPNMSDEERIARADQRTRSALATFLAQDSISPVMGTGFRLRRHPSGINTAYQIGWTLPDKERLGYLATLLRPFQLESESIYHGKVIDSLRRFTTTDAHEELVGQLTSLWNSCQFGRMTTHLYDQNGHCLTPEGASDVQIADRHMYSHLVHADAVDPLQDISTEWQLWSLAGLVGDWLATVSYQQLVMHTIRPNLVPDTTPWAGDTHTIFRRLGLPTHTIGAEDSESSNHS